METKIELSKSKLILMFLGSILFVFCGLWFIYKPANFSGAIFYNKTLIYIIGTVSILFFGLCGFYIFKKIFDNKPGLIINSKGITDNSSGLSLGLIPWEDIIEIGRYNVVNQKFIVLILKNPETYINKATSKFAQRAMRVNLKMSNSPINISANSLKINFKQLFYLLDKNLKEYKN